MARWWRHPAQAAQTLYGLLRDDLAENVDLEALRADARESWRLVRNSNYRPLVKRADLYRQAQEVDPWPGGPYVGTPLLEFLVPIPVSEGCCRAVRHPDTHRRHIHDVKTDGGLSVALAATPEGCECGRPWPCAVLRGSRFSAPLPETPAPPITAGEPWLWPNGDPVRVAYTCLCGVSIEAAGARDLALARQQHEESDEHRGA